MKVDQANVTVSMPRETSGLGENSTYLQKIETDVEKWPLLEQFLGGISQANTSFASGDYDWRTHRWDRENPMGYVDGLNLYGAYFDVNGVDVHGMNIAYNESDFKLGAIVSIVGSEGFHMGIILNGSLYISATESDSLGDSELQTKNGAKIKDIPSKYIINPQLLKLHSIE